MKKLLFLLIALAGSTLKPAAVAIRSVSPEEAFIEKHLVDNATKTLLDQYSRHLAHLVKKIHATQARKHGVWQFPGVPGRYVKYNIKRVIMRNRLARCIEEEGLALLHTPQKYLYHIKGQHKNLHNLNYVVVINELHADPEEKSKPMTLEQIKQVITLIEKTGHCSTFGHNYLRLSDGRISFIDTDGTFNKENPIQGIIGLLNHDLSTYYTPKALYYILDTVAQHLAHLSRKENDKAHRHLSNFLGDQSRDLKNKLTMVLTKRIAQYKKQYY